MTSSDVYLDPAWRLDRFDPTGAEAIFIRADRERVSEAPFLDQRWRRKDDTLASVDVQSLVANAPRTAPPAFIWHSAFCCSTLLAGVLDHEGAVLGVREPDMLMTLANLKRQGQAVSGVMPAVLNWLSRGYEVSERAVIKPTNLANNLMSDVMAASPASKAILLTSSLRAFILSIVKKGEAGRGFARFMYTVFAMDGRALPISEVDRMRLSDLQIAALVWHMQIAEMNALTRGAGAGRVAWLDGDAFVADPEPVLSRVADFLELGLSEDQIRKAATGPKMARNAKAPDQDFASNSRAEHNDQIARSLGPDLERIIEWSYGLHTDTPSDNPVAPALLG